MRTLGRLFISPWLSCPVLALLLLVASLTDLPFLLQLEYPIYDQLLALKKAPSNDQVVLIAIDPYSRNQLGDDIGSRSNLTTMIDKVHQLGGDQIALLTELSFPERKSSGKLSLRHKPNAPALILALENTRENISSAGTSTIASLPLAPLLPAPQQLLLDLQNPLAEYRLNRPEPWNFLPPQAAGAAAAFRTGHLIFTPDPDGKIRSQELLTLWKKQLVPSLPLQLALQAKGLSPQQLEMVPLELDGSLQARGIRIPVIAHYRMLLEPAVNGNAFQTYRASDLLQNKLEPDSLRRKTVLIGPTGSYGDIHRVTGHGIMSTSELAAQTTATLLAGSAPQRPYWAWLAESAALLYFLVLLIVLVPRLSLRTGAIILLLFLTSWISIAAGALILFATWLKVVPGALLCLGGFIQVRWHMGYQEKYRHEQENNRVLAQRFQEQGLLDLALEKALLIKPNDKPNRTVLYNLGLEFERKRMPHNAVSVYQHLLQAGRFQDAKTRLRQLERHDRTVALGSEGNATVALNRPGEKPTLGRYRIERELGQGAMGTVYLGIDPKINRQVAIKTLAYQIIDAEELPKVKERFFREAETAGRLSHPNIVTIYDVGEEADLAFLAMELLAGEDLSHYCRKKKRLPVSQVIGILSQAAAALDYAHREGVVHRDIKPANMILLQDGQIKVADFGIARVAASSQTETGIILGTPNYMSPEQVAGKKVDGRSDLFSLGIVMYELLGGEKPFQGENLTALMYNISNANYRPLREIRPKLPAACYTIVNKLLQKTLTRRFKSAAVLRQELESLQRTLESS